jgi:hypothetical protein
MAELTELKRKKAFPASWIGIDYIICTSAKLKSGITNPEFKRAFRRTIIFIISAGFFVILQKNSAFANDLLKIGFGAEKVQTGARLRKRDKFLKWAKTRTSASSLGVLAGVTVAATASFSIYTLYNENLALTKSLGIAHANIELWNKWYWDNVAIPY